MLKTKLRKREERGSREKGSSESLDREKGDTLKEGKWGRPFFPYVKFPYPKDRGIYNRVKKDVPFSLLESSPFH